MAKSIIILSCIGILQGVVSLLSDKYFFMVYIDQTLLDSAQTLNIQNIFPRITGNDINVSPSALCANIPWCRIICERGSGVLTMLDIFVLPFADKNTGPNALKCWTLSRGRRALDLTPVTVVRVSPLHPSTPTRVAASLLDGIYTFAMNECWNTRDLLNPYVLYDLQFVTTISKVMIVGQKINYISGKFSSIEIRIGTTNVAGNNFSSYTLLGYYSGTASENEIYKAIPSTPVSGRYLSIQRPDANTIRGLQVCHLEIYT